jgi:adenylate kinase
VRVVVTGTPGTGKTTATEQLDRPVLHLNDAVRDDERLTESHDDDRDSLVADMDAVTEFVAEREAEAESGPFVVDSHLSHRLDADRVVVLRCRPDELEDRLRERGESAESAAENRESEALDVVLSEAVERHGRDSVYEIDTTDATADETAAEIAAVIDGERDPSAGEVNFLEYV